MKKILILSIIMICTVLLTGCGSNKSENQINCTRQFTQEFEDGYYTERYSKITWYFDENDEAISGHQYLEITFPKEWYSSLNDPETEMEYMKKTLMKDADTAWNGKGNNVVATVSARINNNVVTCDVDINLDQIDFVFTKDDVFDMYSDGKWTCK